MLGFTLLPISSALPDASNLQVNITFKGRVQVVIMSMTSSRFCHAYCSL
jgi:hypothetical protein